MIGISSLDILQSIVPDLKEIAHFTSETIEKDSDFHARQFNPLAGIDEDPITGVAAGALACYVQHIGLSDKTRYVVEQGYVMDSGEKIYVDTTERVTVGGYGVVYGTKNIDF